MTTDYSSVGRLHHLPRTGDELMSRLRRRPLVGVSEDELRAEARAVVETLRPHMDGGLFYASTPQRTLNGDPDNVIEFNPETFRMLFLPLPPDVRQHVPTISGDEIRTLVIDVDEQGLA